MHRITDKSSKPHNTNYAITFNGQPFRTSTGVKALSFSQALRNTTGRNFKHFSVIFFQLRTLLRFDTLF